MNAAAARWRQPAAPKAPGAHRRSAARERQRPGFDIFLVQGGPNIGVLHPDQVVEDEAQPAQSQPVELLEHRRALFRVDAVQPGDLPGHGLDGSAVEVSQELGCQGLVKAHQHDGRLAHRRDRGRKRGSLSVPGIRRLGKLLAAVFLPKALSGCCAAGRAQCRFPSRSCRAASLTNPPLQHAGRGFRVALNQLANSL